MLQPFGIQIFRRGSGDSENTHGRTNNRNVQAIRFQALGSGWHPCHRSRVVAGGIVITSVLAPDAVKYEHH